MASISAVGVAGAVVYEYSQPWFEDEVADNSEYYVKTYGREFKIIPLVQYCYDRYNESKDITGIVERIIKQIEEEDMTIIKNHLKK